MFFFNYLHNIIANFVLRVLLKPADKIMYREKLKNPNMPYLTKKATRKKILGKKI